MSSNKNCRNYNALIMIFFLLSLFHISLSKLSLKKKQVVSKSFSCKENAGEQKNIYITHRVLKSCLTINNNSQAYLAPCNGSQNQQWNVKYDDQTSDLSIIHSYSGWALEYYFPQNPQSPKNKFPIFSYEYLFSEKNRNLFLNGLPIYTAPLSGKINQKFSFYGNSESFTIKTKDFFGTVSINSSDPNNIIGIYNDNDLRNKNLSFWSIRKFNFSEEAKNKKEQRPQILRNSFTNECLTVNRRGDVLIRRCLGIDGQFWFVERINEVMVLRNKQNNFSLDVKENRLVTSTYSESNKNQRWTGFISFVYPGYLMIVSNEDSKSCVSINSNNWNDDYLYLERCDAFNKMQQFKFEFFNESPLYYNSFMPVSYLESRYFVNKGTGLCVDVSDKNVFKNVECKDIPDQKFSVFSKYIQGSDEVKIDYGFKNILIYNPNESDPTSIYMSSNSEKIIRGGVTIEFFLRFIYSEVYYDAFQLTNDDESDFRCVSVKKEGNSYYLVSEPCDPTNKFQHWQLVRVQDLGKNLTPVKPINHELPSEPKDEPLTSLRGEFRNGTSDKMIPTSELEGLTIEFRSKEGNVITSTIEGSKYSVNLKKGVYKVTIKSKNFTEFVDDITIGQEKTLEKHFLLSPNAKGAIRVILTWNNKVKDLDLFAKTRNEQVFFNRNVSNDGTIHLDIDKREGFGPETITIDEKNKDDRISFIVDNYSKEASISESEANVKIYIDNRLVENLNVPVSSDSSLTAWVLGIYIRSENKFVKSDKLIKFD